MTPIRRERQESSFEELHVHVSRPYHKPHIHVHRDPNVESSQFTTKHRTFNDTIGEEVQRNFSKDIHQM